MLLCGSNRELVVALRWPFLGWITFLSFDFYLFGRSAIVYPINALDQLSDPRVLTLA